MRVVQCLLWGALIGGTLGLMEAVVSLQWWQAFGQPDFLVRPHQTWILAAIDTMAGTMFGVGFGGILLAIAPRTGAKIRFMSLYMALIAEGLVVFVPLYYFEIKHRFLLWPLEDAVLFAAGIATARLMMRKKDAQPSHTITPGPSESRATDSNRRICS